VDLKNAPGSVKEGAAKDATTTIKLAEEDLIALARGDSAEALHQHGKLRIDGEVPPAHKLAFLKGLG
jgi:(3R)-3-hydroxyacyl-CoA dehydrogenase / 3a,7a,12a-trihydroxy-5b-cholest-24-enoyl-CoA hydratase / enoyl-CoA hydratase 2